MTFFLFIIIQDYKNLLKTFITGDEICIYGYDLETKA